MAYDDLLKHVVGRRFEIKMFIVFFLNALPNIFQLCSLAILMYVPPIHHCDLPAVIKQAVKERPMFPNTSFDFMIPFDENSQDGERSKCYVYNRSSEEIESFLNSRNNATVRAFFAENASSLVPCENGHEFENPYGRQTIAMEFSWICERSWMKPALASIYLTGKIVASFSGFLSDKFGRRPVFNISTFLLYLLLFLESFVGSTTTYGVTLFFAGTLSLVNFIAGFVLGTEITVPENRNFLAISSFLAFSLGYGVTTFVWYLSPDWRWFLRICGLTGFLYIANLWLIPESPRWLMSNGRIEEAKTVFKKIARESNKPRIPAEVFEAMEKEACLLMEEKKQQERRSKMTKTFLRVFKEPRMIVNVCVCCYSWFSVALIYYGIYLSVQSLSGNLMINNTLMGLVEIPGFLLVYFAVQYISRPLSHGGLTVLSGLLCLGAAFLAEVNMTASTIVGFAGKGVNAAVFYIAYIHTAEVFPTVTRNSFMSISSFSGRIGSVISPYIIYLGELNGMYITFLVMSFFAISSGVLTLLFLPDTKGAILPETVDDSMKLPRFSSRLCNRRSKKRQKQLTALDGTTSC